MFFVGDTRSTEPYEDEEVLKSAYSPAGCGHVYSFNIGSDNEFVYTEGLLLDDETKAELDRVFGDEMRDFGVSVDDDFFERILTENGASFGDGDEDYESFISVDEMLCGEGGWHIQRIRAEAARRQGFFGVIDNDEQGRVFIIDTSGHEDLLNASISYRGYVDA